MKKFENHTVTLGAISGYTDTIVPEKETSLLMKYFRMAKHYMTDESLPWETKINPDEEFLALLDSFEDRIKKNPSLTIKADECFKVCSSLAATDLVLGYEFEVLTDEEKKELKALTKDIAKLMKI